MTAYQFSQPWLSKMNDPEWMPTAQEFANIRNYLKGLDDGSIKLFNPSFTNPLSVSNGGTGASTLTGYIKGSGTSAFTGQAVPIPVSDGGTNSITALANGLLMVSSGGKIIEIAGNTSAGSTKITSLAAGTTNGDSVRYEQLPAVSGTISNYASYTPTFTGLGTVSGVNAEWRRVGDVVQVRGSFGCGTVAAAQVSISLPNSITQATNETSVVGQIVGSNAPIAGARHVLSNAGTNTVKAGFSGSAVNGTTFQNGNTMFSTSEVVYFIFVVSISGWSI